MNSKSSKQTKGKKQVNPIQRRVPRPKLKLSFDGQLLNGTGYLTPMSSLFNFASAVYPVDCSQVLTVISANNVNQSVSYDLQAITRYYNQFVYRSLKFSWIPYVSPGIADGGSQVYIAYIDNSEQISNAIGAAPSVIFSETKAARNARFFNAWERFEFNVPLTRRHNSFDQNTVNTYAADTCDRSVQGAVIVATATNSAAVNLGQWRVTYELELRELNPGMLST